MLITRTTLISSIFAGAVACLSTTAYAYASKPSLAKQRETIQAVNYLADCYMATEQKKIEVALTADPRSGAFERWADGHISDCYVKTWMEVGHHVDTTGEVMRYALAEAIFRKRYRETHLLDLATVQPLSQGIANYKWQYSGRLTKQELEEDAAEQRAGLYLAFLGECVVRADPEGSRNLLLSEVFTPPEDSAFATLTSSLQSCVDKSREVQIDRTNLRGAIALEYVRLALAPRQIPANPAGVTK